MQTPENRSESEPEQAVYDAATLLQLFKPVAYHILHQGGGVTGSIVSEANGKATVFTARNDGPDMKLVMDEVSGAAGQDESMEVTLIRSKGSAYREEMRVTLASGESSTTGLPELSAAYEAIKGKLTDRPEQVPPLDYEPPHSSMAARLGHVARFITGS